MKYNTKIAIVLTLILNIILEGNQVLTPTFDSDIYHFTGKPTSSVNDIGVSYGSPPHSQSAFFEFDLTAITNPIQTAIFRLYVLSRSNGAIDLIKQTSERQGGMVTPPWGGPPAYSALVNSDFVGNKIMSFEVPEVDTWLNLDITDVVNEWILSPSTNYGLSLIALADNPFTDIDESELPAPVNQGDPSPTISAYFASSAIGSNIPEILITEATNPEPLTNKDINLKLINYNQLTHNNLDPNHNIEYQWSNDFVTWNEISTNVSENIYGSATSGINTILSINYNIPYPNTLYFRIVIN